MLHQQHFLARKLDGGELVLAILVLEPLGWKVGARRTLRRFLDGKTPITCSKRRSMNSRRTLRYWYLPQPSGLLPEVRRTDLRSVSAAQRWRPSDGQAQSDLRPAPQWDEQHRPGTVTLNTERPARRRPAQTAGWPIASTRPRRRSGRRGTRLSPKKADENCSARVRLLMRSRIEFYALI
jgi:hypothetical protein